jgi:hypothetical protein
LYHRKVTMTDYTDKHFTTSIFPFKHSHYSLASSNDDSNDIFNFVVNLVHIFFDIYNFQIQKNISKEYEFEVIDIPAVVRFDCRHW